MKAILITILCAMSMLLSAQTIDFDEVTFTNYATVMSRNDLSNPSALRNIHNGKFTVYQSIDDNSRIILIENFTSGNLGIESIYPERSISTLNLSIHVIDDHKITLNDGSIGVVFTGVLLWDALYILESASSIEDVEEMTDEVNPIYVVLYYASKTETSPNVMTVHFGSVNTFPRTVFYNDTANYSANRPSQGIKSSATSGTLNGHEWVDLGLPSGTKWATCNIGTSTPSGYGNYYAWGETSTKSSYTEANSRTYGKNISDFSGNTYYDAAAANWGSGWRMPTYKEFQELKEKCRWTLTTLNGRRGYRVTGPNGMSIFLPMAGANSSAGNIGYYYSSSPWFNNTQYAYQLYFDGRSEGDVLLAPAKRNFGNTIRPVTD